MKILTVLRIVPVIVGLGFLSGCATPSPLSDLTISADSIKPGADASDAEITIHLVNANEVAAAIAHSTHKLYLNGNYVGKAESHTATPLPRMGSQVEKLKIHFENLGVVQKAIGDANASAVPYRLDSEVFYDVDEDHQSTKLTQSGTIDLRPLGK
ncbi:MAG TPA: hypothetical protein VIM69_05810 [Opitutaceae bacterium]